MNGNSTPVDRELIDTVSEGETLLMKVQAVAKKVEEQVWHAMDAHSHQPPHAQDVMADGLGV
jgi:hypothetical protein